MSAMVLVILNEIHLEIDYNFAIILPCLVLLLQYLLEGLLEEKKKE